MTDNDAALRAIRMFLSHAPADRRILEGLEKHLAPLERQGLLELWCRRDLVPGEQQDATIRRRLLESDMVVVLVSIDYLTTEDCYAGEMAQALALHEQGAMRVIPVIVRPVILEETPFARLWCLPRDARPVVQWKRRDEVLRDVAVGIRRAAAELQRAAARPEQGVLDRRTEGASRRLVTRSRATLTTTDDTVAEVYLTSDLFQVTLPVAVSLDEPAGVLLNWATAVLKLPDRFDHHGRVGVRFVYALSREGQLLTRGATFAAQGIRAGDVLWIETQMEPLAAVPPVRGELTPSRFRPIEDAAAITALLDAIAQADLGGDGPSGSEPPSARC